MERLAGILDLDNMNLLQNHRNDIAEIRIRCGRPFQISLMSRVQKFGNIITAMQLERIISCLMDDSLYSREQELHQGYFTTMEGCRVGVCGKTVGKNGCIDRFSDVGSICIRIPREIYGCADEIAKVVLDKGLNSLLIVSPPSMGKTTMLREIARILSELEYNVAIVDERREIAACVAGVPTMNVGMQSDIMDGCLKAVAIPLLIRACAPDIIIADEIGSKEDADALLDASRCGVKVIASAHGASFTQMCERENIAFAIRSGAFDYLALLGSVPGKIKELRKCADGVLEYAKRDSVISGSSILCGNRAYAVEYT